MLEDFVTVNRNNLCGNTWHKEGIHDVVASSFIPCPALLRNELFQIKTS